MCCSVCLNVRNSVCLNIKNSACLRHFLIDSSLVGLPLITEDEAHIHAVFGQESLAVQWHFYIHWVRYRLSNPYQVMTSALAFNVAIMACMTNFGYQVTRTLQDLRKNIIENCHRTQ